MPHSLVCTNDKLYIYVQENVFSLARVRYNERVYLQSSL